MSFGSGWRGSRLGASEEEQTAGGWDPVRSFLLSAYFLASREFSGEALRRQRGTAGAELQGCSICAMMRTVAECRAFIKQNREGQSNPPHPVNIYNGESAGSALA